VFQKKTTNDGVKRCTYYELETIFLPTARIVYDCCPTFLAMKVFLQEERVCRIVCRLSCGTQTLATTVPNGS